MYFIADGRSPNRLDNQDRTVTKHCVGDQFYAVGAGGQKFYMYKLGMVLLHMNRKSRQDSVGGIGIKNATARTRPRADTDRWGHVSL